MRTRSLKFCFVNFPIFTRQPTNQMINFFRQIRHKLADNNQLFKYSRYAIGEIVLVVFGILIALQINNWNEYKKERVEEIEFLIRIQLDLQKDTVYLKNRIKFMQQQVKNYYAFIHEMYNIQEGKEDFSNLLVGVMWDARELILQDYTFSEITGSGKFGIIEKNEVKESIIDYYKIYSIRKSHISEMNKTGLSLFIPVWPLLSKYFKDTINDKEEMLNNYELEFINDPNSVVFKNLEGSASFYSMKSKRSEKYLKELLVKATDLLKLIEEEIKKEQL